MESFSHLLNQYIRRVGLSDSELARAVGVSRQTVFRWREGLTERPRHREDVLAIAGKLRLTPAEQDTLLLAAGFQPEKLETYPGSSTAPDVEHLPPDEDKAEEIPARPEAEQSPPPPPKIRPHSTARPFKSRPRWTLIVLLGLLLLTLPGLLRPYLQSNDQRPSAAGDSGQTTPVPAAPDETLVLITQFANYAGEQIGYNVAGRLAEGLRQEIEAGAFPSMRVAVWPEGVDRRQQALVVGRQLNATLVIYGEYDAGRVLVKFAYPGNQAAFTGPALQRDVADLQTLAATINTDVPQQVRSLALMALSQIFLSRNKADLALPLLRQAHHNLETDPKTEPHTWAILNFYLGTAHQQSHPPALEEAITAYTEAIQAWPQMISSRLNRSAAYQHRQQSGDLDRALTDANAVVAAAPEWAPAYVNRASVRIMLGGSKNLALALDDLEKGLAVESPLPEAYFNRAYLLLKQNRSIEEAAPDLHQALTLRPAYGAALNMLCWGYAVENQPERALPYCEQAVTAEPDNADYRENRGLAYALAGHNTAAITDFETYVTWLEQQPSGADQTELARHRQWIDHLKTGRNPLTPEVLAGLRREFIE